MTPSERPNALLSGEKDRGIRKRLEMVKLVLTIVSLILTIILALMKILGAF